MKKAFVSICLISALIMTMILPVAAADQKVTFIFEDVTQTDTTTLQGESKIKVSMDGFSGRVSVIQLKMNFTGDLDYKSTTYLANTEGEIPDVMNILPNTAAVNATNEISIAMMNLKGMDIEGRTELFTLTFTGDAGAAGVLSLTQLTESFCTVGDAVSGEKVYPSEGAETDLAASESANESLTAQVQVTLDKVTDFAAVSESGAYAASELRLSVESENIPGYGVYTELNNVPVSAGGHRDATVTIPTFVVNHELVVDTYSVTLSGMGYTTFHEEGVTFEEPLKITNEDFVPGDVNGDGTVTQEDYDRFIAVMEDETLNSFATDFNRDGVTDSFDEAVFGENFEPSEGLPGLCTDLEAEGGDEEIYLTWEKPADSGTSAVTGYEIQYGTKKDEMTETYFVTDEEALSATITGLEDGTTYYICIAAKNEKGTGPFTEPVRARTDSSGGNSGSNSGGGGNGGSYSGGSRPGSNGNSHSGGNTNINNNGGNTNPAETFSDIANYGWARDAIYALNERGIIRGVSETEFAPGNQIKRGDFILILTRMLTIDEPFTENFADVAEGSYYYNAIGSAKAVGIAQGSENFFMPENSITRQDLIVLAYRAFLERGYIEETTDLSVLDTFSDRESIADYAKAAMASMVASGIIQGSDGGVNPLGSATRAETAVMCARLLELMK